MDHQVIARKATEFRAQIELDNVIDIQRATVKIQDFIKVNYFTNEDTVQFLDSLIALTHRDLRDLEDDDASDFLSHGEPQPAHLRNFLSQFEKECAKLRFELINAEPLIADQDSESDVYEMKVTEKVILLHELGILELLRNYSSQAVSINNLAGVLSLITGENQKTLQSYLNPIYSKQAISKNNPLEKEKLVQKVRQQLVNLNFIRKRNA
jgi:hypothetical protein